MIASRFHTNFTLTPDDGHGIHATIARQDRFKPNGNHDADVTRRWQEICYNVGLAALAT